MTTLIDEVRGLFEQLCTLDPTGHPDRHPEWPLQLRGDEDATSELIERLNRLNALLKTGGWIPVSERMPEPREGIYYIVWRGKEMVWSEGFCYVDDDGLFFMDREGDELQDATYWMPAPEAPKP